MIMFNDNKLDDFTPLGMCKPTTGLTNPHWQLHCHLKCNGEVYVRTSCDNNYIALRVDRCDCIDDILSVLHSFSLYGTLFYGGRPLRVGSNTLSQYSVQMGSTLDMIEFQHSRNKL